MSRIEQWSRSAGHGGMDDVANEPASSLSAEVAELRAVAKAARDYLLWSGPGGQDMRRTGTAREKRLALEAALERLQMAGDPLEVVDAD